MGNQTGSPRTRSPTFKFGRGTSVTDHHEVFEHYSRPSESSFTITNAYEAMSPWIAIHLSKPDATSPETPSSSRGLRRESISNSFAKLRRASVAAFERASTPNAEDDKSRREEEEKRRAIWEKEAKVKNAKSTSYLPSYMSVSPNGRMMFVQFSQDAGLYCFRIGNQDIEYIEESSLAACDSPHISWLVHGAYATLVSRCSHDLKESHVLESELRVYNEWKSRMARRPHRNISKTERKYCFQIRNITCTNMSESGVGPCLMITSQVPSNLFAYSESMRQLQIFGSRIRKGGDDFESVLVETENNTERSLDIDLHEMDMMQQFPHVMSHCPNLQWVMFQAGIFQWRIIPRIFHRHADFTSSAGTRSRHGSNASSRRVSLSSTGAPAPFVNDCDPKVDLIFDPVNLFTYNRDGDKIPCQLFERGEIREICVIEETENSCLIALIERKKVPGQAKASWLSVGRIYRENEDQTKSSVDGIYEQLVSLKLHPFGGETLKCCWWTTRYLIFTLPNVSLIPPKETSSASFVSSGDGESSSSEDSYDSDLTDSFCDLFALDVSRHSETQLKIVLDLLGEYIDSNRDIARIILNYSKNLIIQRCRLTTVVRTFQESQLDADALIQAHLRGNAGHSQKMKEFTIRSVSCDEFGQTLCVEMHDGENAVFFVHSRPLGDREFAVDPLFDSYVHWAHLFADVISEAYFK